MNTFYVLCSYAAFAQTPSEYFTHITGDGHEWLACTTRNIEDATLYQTHELALVAVDGFRTMGYKFRAVPHEI